MKNKIMRQLSRAFICTLLIISLSSCTAFTAERNYNIKYWEHKERMLDLEYLRGIHKLKDDVELEQLSRYLDSIKSELNLR